MKLNLKTYLQFLPHICNYLRLTLFPRGRIIVVRPKCGWTSTPSSCTDGGRLITTSTPATWPNRRPSGNTSNASLSSGLWLRWPSISPKSTHPSNLQILPAGMQVKHWCIIENPESHHIVFARQCKFRWILYLNSHLLVMHNENASCVIALKFPYPRRKLLGNLIFKGRVKSTPASVSSPGTVPHTWKDYSPPPATWCGCQWFWQQL